MTAQTKNRVAGVAVTLVGLFLAWLVTTGWASKVDRGEYDLHIQRDSLWKAEQRAMTLDVLCSPTIDPDNRRCR